MFAAFRTAARTAQRAYSTAAPAGASGTEFEAARQAVADHAKHSAELWRKITYYVAFPSIIIGFLNAKALADEHEKHLEHIKEENDFNKREKAFPWGDNTPFFNPHVNIPVE
ncbi:cytochrome c oxidase, subunit VIa [Rhodotorula diobovata]|uniref:Cytochrome c oxidase, subunit VIa n=1 Tax=Rhodotorula diobovata TaxID=5288 RepID=A0A5C5G192_9BASI|nr:cytochrome c oxidase, subunit VIa [Rhodotorula diobovata]